MLRRLEARGEIQDGRLVAGFMGEQFAHPQAVKQLRDVLRSQPSGQIEVISAGDPLDLVSILAGQNVPAVPGNRIVFRDGVSLASLEKGMLSPFLIRRMPT